MAVPAYEVFVAYSGADEDLKDVVVSALAEHMKLKTRRAISSRIFAFRDAPSGEDWLERNTQAVAKARVSVVLLTPNSVYSPWVHYEIGANRAMGLRTPWSSGCGRSKTGPAMVVGLAKGLRSGDLPLDLADFFKTFRSDFVELDSKAGAHKFLTSVAEILGNRISCKPSTLASIVRVAKGVGGWGVTSRCAHATDISRSPFTFMTYIGASTTKHILDFGQNLNSLFGKEAAAAERRRILLKQLLKKGGPTVEIIICDKDYLPFVQSWCELMGSSYEGHLANATQNLVKFWERYANLCGRAGKKRRMDVYAVKVMPSSFTFINPKQENGLLFVKPQIAGEPTTRPIFCLAAANRHDRATLGYYAGYLRQLLRTKGFAKKLALVKGKAVLKPVMP